ncbi:hypothetical protein CPB83DRAFT_884225 [Crepidotus variabilis]|uniref:Uncharacterized protein n=1 Tax=Crepidotus variabilis TaxID=179855 RepID=A0A9P6EE94_9AGAR|nr:hypothetical protein CPB83DRAFT_884225 [Crepidotus variabilis]
MTSHIYTLSSELIDEIIDDLSDPDDIQACSLVCHLFLPRCQYHIFNTFRINSVERTNFTGLRETLEMRPILKTYVRRFKFEISYADTGSRIPQGLYNNAEFLQLMAILFPVQNLTLELQLCLYSQADWTSFAENLWKPFIAPCIATLILKHFDPFPGDSILQCPNLTSISTVETMFKIDGPTLYPPPYLPHLTFLEVGTDQGFPSITLRDLLKLGDAETENKNGLALEHLTNFVHPLDDILEFQLVESVIQRSAQSLESMTFKVNLDTNRFLFHQTEDSLSFLDNSDFLQKSTLPSFKHIKFHVATRLIKSPQNPFSTAALLLPTFVSISNLSRISLQIWVPYSYSYSDESCKSVWTQARDDLKPLDEVLFNLHKQLLLEVCVEVQEGMRIDETKEVIDFVSDIVWNEGCARYFAKDNFLESCFPLAIQSEFISQTYSWMIISSSSMC